MSEKIASHKGHQPRTLTASEIRSRVEGIAEDLAKKLQADQLCGGEPGLEAIPLDTRKFVVLMSDFIGMN